MIGYIVKIESELELQDMVTVEKHDAFKNKYINNILACLQGNWASAIYMNETKGAESNCTKDSNNSKLSKESGEFINI